MKLNYGQKQYNNKNLLFKNMKMNISEFCSLVKKIEKYEHEW